MKDDDVISRSKRKIQMEKNLKLAAENADWDQVISNGGPPCFHLEGTKFCLRAKRWVAHDFPGRDHVFVSLRDLLEVASKRAPGGSGR